MQLLSKLLALSKKLARLKYRISCLMLHESVIAIDQNLGYSYEKKHLFRHGGKFTTYIFSYMI